MFKLKSLLAGAALGLAGIGANAAVAEIQMSGVNVVYFEATGQICDAGGSAGSLGSCQGGADALNTMEFLIDGSMVGMYAAPANSISFNMALLIKSTDPTVLGSASLVPATDDVFDAQINGNPGLFTDVVSGSVNFAQQTKLTLGGSGVSGISTTFPPSLPFGLVAGDPLDWSFTSLNGVCTGDAGSRVCTYSGVANISWDQQVPEPSTLLLAGVSLLGLAFARRRQAR